MVSISSSTPPAAAANGAGSVKGPLVLKDLGSFYIGGRTVHTEVLTGDAAGGPFPPNDGETTVDQMYVQYAIPEHGTHIPVVMVHGGVMTGANYETTPDGRMGWRDYFVRKGRGVYLVDQVWRGRSGFDPALVNEARIGRRPAKELPLTLRLSHDHMWTWLRFGPAPGKAYPDGQFPVDAMEQFNRQQVPQFVPAPNAPNPTPASLTLLTSRIGGAILVGHSESSFFPERAAFVDPTHIRGIVSLESAYSPETFAPNEIAILAKIPILFVFSDHLGDGPPEFASKWTTSFARCQGLVQQIRAAGGDATLLFLPEIGLHGNSHMMMMDKNNLQVADVILAWIDEHVESRGKTKPR